MNTPTQAIASAGHARVLAVDALRGFALLGILLANLPFAYDYKGITRSTAELIGSPETDATLRMLFQLLIDKKFITVFSMLFGFGFYIQMERAEAKGMSFRSYFFKRMLILLAMASLHAYLLWFGDIVRSYAIGGIFLLLFYKMRPRTLLITALIFNVLLTGLIFIGNSALGWQTYSYDYNLTNEIYITPSYFRYLEINATIDSWRNFLQDQPLTLSFTFGNMLIGFLLGKIGFFQQVDKYKTLTNRLIVSGAVFGLIGSYLFYAVSNGKMEMDMSLIWLPWVLVAGMLLQSLCYVSAFLRLFALDWVQPVLAFFAPVGKMALTNYVLQSMFYALVFFHWSGGLQLFGKITFTETYLIGLGLYIVQLIFSHLWLRIAHQGPLEKVWKGLAYRFA